MAVEIDAHTALEHLRQNIMPAIGCTDPITPALAGAIAYQAAGKGTALRIEGHFSNDVWIGARNVVIPGTLRRGMKNAIALGIAGGDPARGLLVLSDITEEHVTVADRVIETAEWTLGTSANKGPIYVDLKVVTGCGTARVVFNGSHNEFRIVKDGEEDAIQIQGENHNGEVVAFPADLNALWHLADTFETKDLEFLAEGVRMNCEANRLGLAKNYPMNLGRWLRDAAIYETNSAVQRAKVSVCAAVDARMGGEKIPIMSVFGSGNQGILLFNTLGVWAEHHGIAEDKMTRSLALAGMVAGRIRYELRAGAPFCKCALIAATAASAGLVYLMNGSVRQAELAAQMTLTALAGILCDGAKPGCSLKLSVACSSAIENASLAVLPSTTLDGGGLLGENLFRTVQKVATVGSESYQAIQRCLNELV